MDLTCRLASDATLVFSPAMPRGPMQKTLRLFYQLTRGAVGTGIGLALVRQRALAMQGRIDVLYASPGAGFGVSFPEA